MLISIILFFPLLQKTGLTKLSSIYKVQNDQYVGESQKARLIVHRSLFL